MPSYYKLIECVERTVPLTYVNSLGFENTCGSASSTPFAFSKTEDFPPHCLPVHRCLFSTEHTLFHLFLTFFVCLFFEKLIHIHGEIAKQYKRVHSEK